MKSQIKYFYILLLIIWFVNYGYGNEKLNKLLEENDISFLLLNENDKIICSVSCNYGKISCNYGTDYIYLECISNKVDDENLYIEYAYSVFNLYGIPSFREFDFPQFYKFSISKKQIEARILDIKNKVIKNKTIPFSSNCLGISICNNLRIREKPNTNSTTKVIGKLNKWDKVTVVDCTNTKDKIENLEYPWYKIKLEDGQEGWVFGGFTKIYFSDEDLALLYKAFEKEGSEYTNQFLTPDNS